MLNRTHRAYHRMVWSGVLVGVLVLAGCSRHMGYPTSTASDAPALAAGSAKDAPAGRSEPATAPAKSDKAAQAKPAKPAFSSYQTGKGGSQLWAENCTRCHNNRDPGSLSATQWVVAMHQMRVRANLTAEEHAKILQFLQSASH